MPVYRGRDRHLRYVQSPAQKAFADRMNDALARLDRLPDAYMRDVLEDLVKTRHRILDRMVQIEASPEGLWEWHHLRSIDLAVYEALDDWSKAMVARMDGALETAWELGAGAYVGALEAGGVASAELGLRLPTLFRHQLQIAQAYQADLVKGLAISEKERLMAEIRRGITGERFPHEIMRDVMHLIDKPTRPGVKFGRLSYQAQRIVHTELKRVFNMANNASMKHTAGMLGAGGHKIWLHSGQPRQVKRGGRGGRPDHIDMHRVTIPANSKFVVGGHACEGPYDPMLPAEHIINCRCSAILWYDRWGDPPPDVNRYTGP